MQHCPCSRKFTSAVSAPSQCPTTLPATAPHSRPQLPSLTLPHKSSEDQVRYLIPKRDVAGWRGTCVRAFLRFAVTPAGLSGVLLQGMSHRGRSQSALWRQCCFLRIRARDSLAFTHSARRGRNGRCLKSSLECYGHLPNCLQFI